MSVNASYLRLGNETKESGTSGVVPNRNSGSGCSGTAVSSPSSVTRSTRLGSTQYLWEFPGYGKVHKVTGLEADEQKGNDYDRMKHHHQELLLGELPATAICGNDITSSCLYVCGLCAADAGVWAPLSVGLVIATLYLFRRIYVEVCTALPMNGGTFNVLLHTTTKKLAAAAACMSILSYVATGVVSASEAVNYLSEIWSACPVHLLTVVLLAVFAFLNLIGISESAGAAIGIFAIHTTTLIILFVASILHISKHGISQLNDSYHSQEQTGVARAIFFGFGTAMLGVSGFESSAQFIEEQKPGVFEKTLRNMWIAVALINPTITFLALCVIPLEDIKTEYKLTLLARLGHVTGGEWLRYLVSIDAFLVLSGAVLTAYVGVVGLIRRLSLDACMPEFLLARNKLRDTNHYIIIGFFLICTSMFFILNGDASTLSKVYSVCFLGLMIMFCIGNLMLKTKRGQLRRDTEAPVWSVIIGLLMVIWGLSATIAKNNSVLSIFAIYYSGTFVLVGIMFFRMQVMRWTHRFLASMLQSDHYIITSMEDYLRKMSDRPLIFFMKGDSARMLNKALLYIRDNEDTQFVKIVHFKDAESVVLTDSTLKLLFSS